MVPYLAISGLVSLGLWLLILLPAYLTDRGWSSQAVGWAVGSYFLFNLVFQVLAGRIADRFGSVRVALVGAFLGVAGGVGYVVAAWQPWFVFLARFTHAAGAALIYVGALMQLVESVPVHFRGRVIGYYGLPGFVMIGIGPMIAEWFSLRWGASGVFAIEPGLFVLLTLVIWRLPRSGSRIHQAHQPIQKAFRESFHPLRSVLALSVVFGFCFSAWNGFLAPAVRSIGHGGVSGFGFGYGLGAVVTRLGVSHRLDRGTSRYFAISTLVLYGACLAWIPRATGVPLLLVLGMIGGMVHGVFYPALSSVAAERFHPLHTGQAMSLYISASALGMFVGPPLWGALADVVGYPPVFWTSGLIMAGGTAWFIQKHRRVDYGSFRSEEASLPTRTTD